MIVTPLLSINILNGPLTATRKLFLYSALTWFILNSVSANLFSQSIDESDGVRIVKNGLPLWDDINSIGLEMTHVYTTYIKNTMVRRYLNPFDSTLGPDGNVFIADAGNNLIHKYDRNGNFLRSFGRSRPAADRFSGPVFIDIDKSGIMYIGMINSSTIEVLSKEGASIRSIDCEGDIGEFRVQTSGNIVMSTGIEFSHFGDEARQRRNKLVRVIKPEGTVVRQFADPLVYRAEGIVIADRSVHMAGAANDLIFLAYKHRNLIEKYSSDGRLLMQIVRPLNFPETKITLRNGIDNLGSEVPNFVSAGIDVDDRGRIWVLTYDRQPVKDGIYRDYSDPGLYKFEIFAANGILLTQIPLEIYGNNFRIFGNRLFIVDVFRDMAVFEFIIKENENN